MNEVNTEHCCDKCGRQVFSNNDVAQLVILLGGDLDNVDAQPRHLLPVIEDGKVVCEGSPSRAQYLEGQPRDTRTDYPYVKAMEDDHRQAYKKMLELFPK